MSSNSGPESDETDPFLSFVTLLNQYPVFFRELSKCVDPAEYDKLSKAMVACTFSANRTLPIIRAIIVSEFEKNVRQPGSILRANSIGSKMCGLYSRTIGLDYLKSTLTKFLKKILDTSDPTKSLEIDPNKLTKLNPDLGPDALDSMLKTNLKELKAVVKDIFVTITSPESVDQMPQEIRAIAGFIAESARIYAPERVSSLVGGFIMLRFFNPCLITPDAFGIVNHVTVDAKARRKLTLVTKVLQNLSNDVRFGKKEEFMIPMNEALDEMMPLMHEFLDRVVVDPILPVRGDTGRENTAAFDAAAVVAKLHNSVEASIGLFEHKLRELEVAKEKKVQEIIQGEEKEQTQESPVVITYGDGEDKPDDQDEASPKLQPVPPQSNEEEKLSVPEGRGKGGFHNASNTTSMLLSLEATSWQRFKDPKMKPIDAASLEAKHLHCVHYHFYQRRKQLEEALFSQAMAAAASERADGDLKAQQDFFALLEALGEPPASAKKAAAAERATAAADDDDDGEGGDDNMSFLTTPIKSGVLSRTDAAIVHKRFYLVLTDANLYYFVKITDRMPHRAVPIDDVEVRDAKKDSNDNYAFAIVTTGKTHVMMGSSMVETDDWIAAIRDARRRYVAALSAKVDVGSLEARMKGFLMGLKVPYSARAAGTFLRSDVASFSFAVSAFGTRWVVDKTIGEMVEFHVMLHQQFPDHIFPPPARVERATKGTGPSSLKSKVRGRIAGSGTKGKYDKYLTSTTVIIDVSPTGMPNDGLRLLYKAIRSYVRELCSNLHIAQCDLVLSFFELDDPFRAVSMGSMAHLEHLIGNGTDLSVSRPMLVGGAPRTPLHCAVRRAVRGPKKGSNATPKLSVLTSSSSGADSTSGSQSYKEGSMRQKEPAGGSYGTASANSSHKKTKSHKGTGGVWSSGRAKNLDEDIWNEAKEEVAIPEETLVAIIRRIVSATDGAAINDADGAGNTALHVAMVNSDMGVLVTKTLLELGARVNAYNHLGQSPLMAAAANGASDLIPLLVEKGAKLTAVDLKGQSALHIAINKRHTEVAVRLLEAGSPLDTVDSDGNTMLMTAIQRDVPPIVEALLAAGIDANKANRYDISPVHVMAQTNARHLLDLVCKAKTSTPVNWAARDPAGNTPLHVAVISRHTDTVALLCSQIGSDKLSLSSVNTAGDTALHIACRHGDARCVEALVRAGASLEAPAKRTGDTPMHVLATHNHAGVLARIAPKCSKLSTKNAKGQTPLHVAAEAGHAAACTALASADAAAAAARDTQGHTALHIACWASQVAAVRAIVASGVDVNARGGHNGGTALHVCAATGNVGCMRALLLAPGVIPDKARKSDEATALHVVIQVQQEDEEKCISLVEALSTAGANLSVPDATGNTALHYALVKPHVKLALTLAANGASLFVANDEMKTPKDLPKVKPSLLLALEECAVTFLKHRQKFARKLTKGKSSKTPSEADLRSRPGWLTVAADAVVRASADLGGSSHGTGSKLKGKAAVLKSVGRRVGGKKGKSDLKVSQRDATEPTIAVTAAPIAAAAPIVTKKDDKEKEKQKEKGKSVPAAPAKQVSSTIDPAALGPDAWKTASERRKRVPDLPPSNTSSAAGSSRNSKDDDNGAGTTVNKSRISTMIDEAWADVEAALVAVPEDGYASSSGSDADVSDAKDAAKTVSEVEIARTKALPALPPKNKSSAVRP